MFKGTIFLDFKVFRILALNRTSSSIFGEMKKKIERNKHFSQVSE